MATSRVCSIPDCDKPLHQRGWCNGHYKRWWRWGDPLGKRKHLVGEQRLYLERMVSTHQSDECLIWPYFIADNGYGRMHNQNGSPSVHRIVCEMAHGPAPVGRQAAHSCGNKPCFNPRHLAWKTQTENMADKLVHGTQPRGETCHLTKLTADNVRKIRRLVGTMPQVAIASQFGITPENVRQIHLRKSWAWLE